MKKYPCLIALAAALSLTACSVKLPFTESTAAETTAQTTQTEQTAEQADDSGSQINAAIGTWEFPLDGTVDLFVIKSRTEAYLTVTDEEMNDLMFDDKGEFYYGHKKVPKSYCSFEDGIFLVKNKGKIVLSMEKTADYEELYGEYKLTSGQFLDEFKRDDGSDYIQDIMLNMQPNHTVMTGIIDQKGFELTEERLSMVINGERIEGSRYKVEGDKMTITNSEGKELVMTRKE